MRSCPLPSLLLVALSVFSAFGAGCAHHPARYGGPLRPRPVPAQALQRVAVVAFADHPGLQVVLPRDRTEALQAAADEIRLPQSEDWAAAISMMLLLSPTPAGAAFLALPLLTPVVTTTDAALQAGRALLQAESPATLAELRRTLRAELDALRLDTLLRERLAAELRHHFGTVVTVVPDATLQRLDPRLPERAWRQDAGVNPATRRHLAEQGHTAILEIRVQAAALVRTGPLNRDLALTANLRVRLLDPASGKELFYADRSFRSGTRPDREWAADTAGLHAALVRGLAGFGDEAATQLAATVPAGLRGTLVSAHP